jgi:hypothetical protein
VLLSAMGTPILKGKPTLAFAPFGTYLVSLEKV